MVCKTVKKWTNVKDDEFEAIMTMSIMPRLPHQESLSLSFLFSLLPSFSMTSVAHMFIEPLLSPGHSARTWEPSSDPNENRILMEQRGGFPQGGGLGTVMGLEWGEGGVGNTEQGTSQSLSCSEGQP